MESPERSPDTRLLVTCERCGAATGSQLVALDEPGWCLRCQLELTIRGCQDVQAEARAARVEAETARTHPRLAAQRADARLDPALGSQ